MTLQVASCSQNLSPGYDMPFVHLPGQFSFYNAEIKCSHGITAHLDGLEGISFRSPPLCEVLRRCYL